MLYEHDAVVSLPSLCVVESHSAPESAGEVSRNHRGRVSVAVERGPSSFLTTSVAKAGVNALISFK